MIGIRFDPGVTPPATDGTVGRFTGYFQRGLLRIFEWKRLR
jgi:hypothetical protein